MYAIVECGGKQYKVEQDMLVKVEKIDAEIGASVELKVLMVADGEGNIKTGEAASVCKVTGTAMARFHYKSKKQIRKRQGHRQPYTELKIVSIEG